MAQPARNNGHLIHPNPGPDVSHLRREIRGFLASLNLALTQSNGQDRITVAIRDWHNRFSERIRLNIDLQEAQNTFIQELQGILVDPLEPGILIETPLIGTDGITYGLKSLRVALSQLPEPLQCRSPIHLEDEAIFTTEPHLVVEHAIRWLKSKGAFVTDPDLDEDYERLLALNQLPEVPTRHDPRIARLLEHQDMRNQRLARERELIARQALEERMQQPPVDDHVFALNHNPDLMEGALRREIRGFLVEANRVLNASPLQDPITVQLRDWQRRFQARVGEHANVENAQNEFIQALQEILLDPIEYIRDPNARTTLEAPLLGSDGEIYGTKSLSICLSRLPEEFRRRSPIHFQNEAVFTTQPHPVAEYTVRWLRDKNANITSIALDAEFQRLVDENRLPVIPTPEIIAREEEARLERMDREERARIRNERIQILMQQQVEENAREAEELARFEADLIARQAQVIQEDFVQPMNERIQEFAQGQFARLDALEQNDQQRVQHLQARIAQFRNNINELEQQNVELRAQLVRLEGNIHQVQREAVQLQIDINETKKAIAERQSGWLGSLLTAVAVVGVCVFATWAIGAALPAGMTASVKPMVGGAGVSIGALF
jgi:hypothetical protein